MQTKADEWADFSVGVSVHIDYYCVPQYGEYPDEMIEGLTLKDIQKQIEHYAKRIGSNARGEEEAVRDCFKIAHYACILRSKIKG